MAEAHRVSAGRRHPLRGDLAAYRAVLASRIRAQRSYRANFALDAVSALVVGLIELAEVWLLFRSVPSLGGLRFAQILLVFGLAEGTYSIADMVFGHCDNLPTYLRAGTLDAFYLRPQPLLAQLVTSDISLRRLTRASVGIGCAAIALSINDIRWDAGRIAMLALVAVCSTAIYAAIFVWAAGVQFFLLDGSEATNAVVYGGRYASTQPASLWGTGLRALFGFVFPLAMTAYVPALYLLGLPGPAWLPAWSAWLLPVAAAWTWGLALLSWRTGVRHYQGGGG